ncbi:hypothetical protein [Coxiella burnetii]|uniref:hypothetical protein n=1 Tax=Coxiella burnetii TaxID=777 RepID=UPI0005944DB0|nr:hypothetical protein [Coxiella burnetii]OYK90925.1 hypothetical protein CbuQ195_05685 [Coxiella burnetii]PNT78519.1 hypothetical protein C2L92_10680 [Coxiella burnetii]PNT79029.1 hypothetical protein C2L91_10710 [Coxiella burnetii]PNT82764.1 hypothetical protein C2L90_10630 [Coxiella burnetii]PNT85730.1 hypothetical protein C2L94_10680 [Coxiella burnetii]
MRGRILNPDATKRSIVAVLIGLMVLVAIYLTVPSHPAEPQGILLPTASSQAPVPADRVSFYNTITAPYVYQRLGNINVQFYSKKSTPEGEARMQQYVREMAARIGANGVIVSLFGHTMPGAVRGAMSSYVFRGVAIYSVPTI